MTTENVKGSGFNRLNQFLHLGLLELLLERALLNHILHNQFSEGFLCLVFGALLTGETSISLSLLFLLSLKQSLLILFIDFGVDLFEFVAVLELTLTDTTFNGTE